MQIFNNDEFGEVRTVIIDNEIWFVGKDVADILRYQNGSRDINRHVDEDDRHKIMLFDGNQDKKTIIINESGLYSLILSSKLESAKRFKRWITSEVLPEIRKTGSYKHESLDSVNTAVNIITGLLDNAGCSNEIKLLTAKQLYEKSGIAIDYEIKADKQYYDTEYIARKIGIYFKTSRKPASKAVNEIIRRIGATPDECIDTWESRGNWQGTVTKYSQSVIDRACDWVKGNNYPAAIGYIQSNGEYKNYHVTYN